MPLVASLLPFRNKLAYPAGVVAGFDPAHPASNSMLFSCVPSGANFLEIAPHMRVGTITNTPSILMDGRIGPTVKFVSLTDAVTFSGQVATNSQVCTMAAIVVMNSVANANQGIFSNSSSGSGGFLMNVATAAFTLNINGVNAFSSGINLTVGLPYFLVMTSSGTNGNINFLVERLDTGQVFTSTASVGASSASAPSGTFSVGTRVGSNLVSLASIAAVMFSYNYMSMASLKAWASDPWAFWYPRTPIDWVGKIAAVTVFPFVRRNIIRASAKGFR